MQSWKAERPPVPVDDVDGMIRWYASLPTSSQTKLTPEFVRRLTEIRLEREKENGAPVVLDPDYAAFENAYSASHAKDTDALAHLKRMRDFALFKIQRAQARNDFPAVQDATRQLTHYSSVIHDEELRAQKLGREIGELLPRPEAERVARAFAYWSLRAAEDILTTVCPRLATASGTGPLFQEEIRQLIEPTLLGQRVLGPIARAAQVSSGVHLPQWFVAALRAGIADTLEDGAAVFDSLYALPPPREAPPVADGGGI
jgi:hypothetical protein